ncbi:MAG TPA: long-chain-acyl-CoA synthetase [Haliangium sp.]|nr:long-chain-acyl-CoA synthetase [Haliangium sp.]
MDPRNRLTWRDFGRGVLALRKKIRPGTRTLATLATMYDHRRLSLGRALERSATRHPDATCIKHEHGEISYAAFNRWVNRIAHHLLASGVRRGDAVAILMDSRPGLLAVTAAVTKLGAVAALLNTQQRRHVLAHSLGCFEPRLYVIGAELVDAFDEVRSAIGNPAPASVRLVRDGGAADALELGPGERAEHAGYIDLDEAIAAQPSDDPPTTAAVRLADPCFYVFTSGTTGLPKASILSHARWLKAATGFGEACLDLGPGDTVYAPLPLYHNLGLTIAWGSALYTGAAVAIRRKFSASAFWDDCRRHRATAFVYIGEIPRYLLNQPPGPRDREHTVRRILGVGLRPELWQEMKRRFGIDEIYEIYAASEMNVSFLNLLNLDQTVGFCPMRWAIVAFDVERGEPVRDARGRLVRVRRGEVGLLLTKVTRRYRFEGYTDTAASARKLLHGAFRKRDVWFDTGDLMREIGFGHLQFVDRVGDTFRWKSENVSTTEVEHVIGAIAGVAECAVYGVEVPGMPGRAGMATLVLAPDGEALRQDLEPVRARLDADLPGYAVPVFLRIADSLTTTGTFKHRKVALRDQGYDPARVREPLFVRLADGAAYVPLTREIHDRIRQGALRL